MKINVANPITGRQKIYDIEDEKKLRVFMEKRIAQEVDSSSVDDSLKGYVLRITGGNDKQGFPMMQGVLTNLRVRLLLDGRTGCFRRPTHDGERKRRTVRGCICSSDLAVINTVIVKKGPQEIAGLTDSVIPRRLGPKRASKIRHLFNLSKEDDVRKFVVRRQLGQHPKKPAKKPTTKAPKIQRLVTSVTLKRKRVRMQNQKKQFARVRAEAAAYKKLLEKRTAEAHKKREAIVEQKREAAKKERADEEKRRTRLALKKIAQREVYASKCRARTANKSHKLNKKQRNKVVKRRLRIEAGRKLKLHQLIQMHGAAKTALLKAKKQMSAFPSRQVVNRIRKLHQKRHELYLRIMSGARLPNLKRQAKHQEKVAAREATRKAALAKKNRRKVVVAEHKRPAPKAAKAPVAKKAKN
jgi:small subunit ribosomal protein S6e